MHRIALATIAVAMLLALPALVYATMNSFTVIYDAPGAGGTATLHVNATGVSVKGTINVTAGMDKCQKARQIAKTVCLACAGGALSTGAACSTIVETETCATQAADIEVRCATNQFRVNHAAATDSLLVRPFPVGTPSLTSVIVKPSQCNELDTETVASGPPFVVFSLKREAGATDGTVDWIVNQGPPVQSASTSTTGKSERQVLSDLVSQLSALGLSGSV